MARPRKDAEDPGAQERMRIAFWELLGQMPFDRITVKGLAQAAGVQRNTFYYHYRGMDELAKDAIAALPIEPYAAGLVTALPGGGEHVANFVFSGANDALIECLFTAAGPNGNPLLVSTLKDRIWDAWCSVLGLAGPRPVIVEFMMGGLLSMFGTMASLSVDGRRQMLGELPLKEIFELTLRHVNVMREQALDSFLTSR